MKKKRKEMKRAVHKKGKESRFSPVRCYTVVDGEPALDSFPFMIGGTSRI